MTLLRRCALTAALLAVAPGAARAADWHLGVEAGTDLPVMVGARVWAEAPYGLRLSTALGVFPGGYVDLVNAILVDAGAYPQETGDVIRDAIADSLVWRTHLGWRHAGTGLYVEGGYALATLGGGVTSEQLLVAVTGADAPSSGGAASSWSAGAMIHMVDAEIGWTDRVWEGLTVRAALGFAGTVAASATVSPDRAPGPLAAKASARLASAAETYLEDTFTSYVFTPVITVGLGWQFF